MLMIIMMLCYYLLAIGVLCGIAYWSMNQTTKRIAEKYSELAEFAMALQSAFVRSESDLNRAIIQQFHTPDTDSEEFRETPAFVIELERKMESSDPPRSSVESGLWNFVNSFKMHHQSSKNQGTLTALNS
jgi:hypothetical protein